MNNKELEKKLDKLRNESDSLIAQVQKWNEDIQELRNAIAKAKEDHDFTRGKIQALEELLKSE